jgi:hypothetical protein
MPHRIVTPRRRNRSKRRSTMFFSSLNDGMPLTSKPPGRFCVSKIVTE